MTDPQLEELISAYLDGELTAAEQTRIEQLLESDATARSLADELRALSSTLQALPQYRLGEDLSTSVLAQAHAAAGNGSATAGRSNPPAARGEQKVSPSSRESSPRENSSPSDGAPGPNSASAWRGLIWGAMAIAASVLIMLFNVEQPVPELAKHDRAGESFLEGADADSEVDNSEVDDLESMLDAFAADGAVHDGLEKSLPLNDEMRRSDMARESRGAASFAIEKAEELGQRSKSAEAESSRRDDRVGGGAGGNAVAGKAGNQRLKSASKSGTPQAVAGALQSEMLDEADALTAQPGTAGDRLTAIDGALFVVNIRASAAKSGAFSKLLAHENIAWSENEELGRDGGLKRFSQREQNAPFADSDEGESVPGKTGSRRNITSEETPVEVVVVEASPEQITRTLTRIQSTPREYAGYELAPNDSPAVQQLAEDYDLVAPADASQLRMESAVEAAPAASDPQASAPLAVEQPAAALGSGGRKADSTRVTKKDKTLHATKDEAASVDRSVTQPEPGKNGNTDYRENQARATRYYVQSRDLPVQARSRSEVQGGIRLVPADEALKPAAPPATQAFSREAKSPPPANAADSVAPQAAIVADTPAPQPVTKQSVEDLVEDLPTNLSATVQRQAAARQSVSRQSRAYFVLRIVPDAPVAAAKVAEPAAKPAAEAVAEPARADESADPDGAPPEP